MNLFRVATDSWIRRFVTGRLATRLLPRNEAPGGRPVTFELIENRRNVEEIAEHASRTGRLGFLVAA